MPIGFRFDVTLSVERASDGLVLSQARVHCRVATPSIVRRCVHWLTRQDGIDCSLNGAVLSCRPTARSDHGTYTFWMPLWLASSFQHFFEKDSNGQQTMPQMENYAVLQDWMVTMPKESVLLDVGAHVGQSALPVAAAGYEVRACHPSAVVVLVIWV